MSDIESNVTQIPEHEPDGPDDLHRAANALLNTLWQIVYSGSRSFEENWLEMDRRFPQARWLHNELNAARASESKLAEARAAALEEAALECVRHAKSEMPITMWKWHPWIKGNLERVTSLNRKMRAKAFIRAAAAIRALKGGANG